MSAPMGAKAIPKRSPDGPMWHPHPPAGSRASPLVPLEDDPAALEPPPEDPPPLLVPP